MTFCYNRGIHKKVSEQQLSRGSSNAQLCTAMSYVMCGRFNHTHIIQWPTQHSRLLHFHSLHFPREKTEETGNQIRSQKLVNDAARTNIWQELPLSHTLSSEIMGHLSAFCSMSYVHQDCRMTWNSSTGSRLPRKIAHLWFLLIRLITVFLIIDSINYYALHTLMQWTDTGLHQITITIDTAPESIPSTLQYEHS